jgi:hypothetical protein
MNKGPYIKLGDTVALFHDLARVISIDLLGNTIVQFPEKEGTPILSIESVELLKIANMSFDADKLIKTASKSFDESLNPWADPTEETGQQECGHTDRYGTLFTRIYDYYKHCPMCGDEL